MAFDDVWGVPLALMFINTPPQNSSAQELYVVVVVLFFFVNFRQIQRNADYIEMFEFVCPNVVWSGARLFYGLTIFGAGKYDLRFIIKCLTNNCIKGFVM